MLQFFGRFLIISMCVVYVMSYILATNGLNFDNDTERKRNVSVFGERLKKQQRDNRWFVSY